jgi:hypothetical protein
MLISNEVRTTRFMDHQTQKIGKPNNLKDLGTTKETLADSITPTSDLYDLSRLFGYHI